MRKSYRLGTLLGVPIKARPAAAISSLVLWIVLSGAAAIGLAMAGGTAVLFGLLATVIHWLGDLVHQMGHAFVARRLGHPMGGLLLNWFLIASFYPRNEPELPAGMHIRRALGGTPVSLGVAIVSGLILWWGGPGNGRLGDGLAYWLLQFIFWENLLVFFVGALLPLGFTDGSTLLYWLPRRHR